MTTYKYLSYLQPVSTKTVPVRPTGKREKGNKREVNESMNNRKDIFLFYIVWCIVTWVVTWLSLVSLFEPHNERKGNKFKHRNRFKLFGKFQKRFNLLSFLWTVSTVGEREGNRRKGRKGTWSAQGEGNDCMVTFIWKYLKFSIS